MYWGFDFIQFLEAGEMLFFTLKSTFKKYNNETGYITVNKENNLVISPFGLKNYENRTYNYLLPFVFQ